MMKLPRIFRRFGKAEKGLAALEFAIICPMMIFLLFGSVDLLDVLGANKRSQNVAASLADVTARDTEVSNSEVAGLWSAIDILMYPDNSSTLQARVTSVSITNASTATVVWSEGHGMAPRTANSLVTLPAAMMIPGSSIIMSETNLNYAAPLHFLYSAPVTIQHTAYRRSRLVDPIPRVP